MRITTYLMFEGRAQEALSFYLSTFDNAEIEMVKTYGQDEEGAPTTSNLTAFRLGETRLMCIDSPVSHNFTFTPATSLFVECDSMSEVDDLADRLGVGGKVLMPLDSYPFAQRFAWITDQFGVSWQLIYAAAAP